MRPAAVIGEVAGPAVRATMRTRRSGQHGRRPTAAQWVGHLTLAVVAAWGVRRLDDLIERRLSRPAGGR